MISEIGLPSVKKSKLFDYAADLPFFKANKKVCFQPGLNILFGPNGCGKSTLLGMMAESLAAEQGGVSTVTQDWLTKVAESSFSTGTVTSALAGIKVVHDGQPLMYSNPRAAVGVRGGHLDDDFMMQGMLDITTKKSTGLKTLQRLGSMLAVLHKDKPFPKEVTYTMSRNSMNSVWQKKWDLAVKLLAGTIPKGQPTLLFDEPESGLAFPAQGNLFDMLHQAAVEHDFQIILATHSVFALGLPCANYIEMELGYLEHAESCLQIVQERVTTRNAAAYLEDAAKKAEAKLDVKAPPKRRKRGQQDWPFVS